MVLEQVCDRVLLQDTGMPYLHWKFPCLASQVGLGTAMAWHRSRFSDAQFLQNHPYEPLRSKASRRSDVAYAMEGSRMM